MSVWLLKCINNIFPLPIHPFNLQNDNVKSYAEWQFEKADNTIQYYLDAVNKDEMFKDKVVLDIGCGAAGKTLSYATSGVKHIYGVDVVDYYEKEAMELANQKGLTDIFTFLCADASKLSFNDNFFDTIIMNDAMEHVDKPLEVLKECYRILKPGGRLFVNFPPYYHPFGAHLSDVIGIPWVHMFFTEKTLINGYKDLVQKHPDAQKRIDFRIGKKEDGEEYFSYINKMTLKRFSTILPQTKYKVFYSREVPLRHFLMAFAKIPVLKEMFVKMAVYILEK